MTLKVEIVTQHLNNLEQFVKDLPGHVNRRKVISTWDFFVQGQITFEKMTKTLRIQDNAALGETALDLAFLRNYPQHFTTKAFTHHEKMQAIQCNSKESGKKSFIEINHRIRQGRPILSHVAPHPEKRVIGALHEIHRNH
ncbi:hypothetical protein PCANC_28432 [Puccinia coronata f. sp. avenae]|uniref:Uncharacterized protein n=1 Tax=Puccinia coronata f. sp. avenae TaxID=200324 RepID=A0A2N5T9K8_9BASI|nr:hypothetical protein PCANC_28432 [Puccinia coronata f. sp. avenae]